MIFHLYLDFFIIPIQISQKESAAMLYDQTHLLVPLVSEEFALLGHHHQCWDSLHLGTKNVLIKIKQLKSFTLNLLFNFSAKSEL